jgi:predicted DNA-binding transcriptional regulator YafY
MSKREVTKRQHLIIRKLKTAKRATFEEISDYLQRAADLHGDNFDLSKRTFARDLEDIENIYGISIKYDFSNKFYFIEEELDTTVNERLFEAFNIYYALKMQEQQSPYVHLEKRRPQGTEHLYDLLHAIKNRLLITFNYQKYYGNPSKPRTVKPLLLKEFKNRWYLFAENVHNDEIKCYALDRLFELEITKDHFEIDDQFDINEYLKYCFGIISPNADEPSEVILSFDPFQGKYIKSLPLHDTQEIIKNTKDELRICLTLYLTHDFLMELLSFGNTVKVIKPKRLISELTAIYARALKQYE